MAIPAISNRGRLRAMIENKFPDKIIDCAGGDTRTDMLGDHIQTLCHKLACIAHAFETCRIMDTDLTGAHRQQDSFI